MPKPVYTEGTPVRISRTTILTQVTVDPYDEAFYAPTKKIGRYMSRDDADIECVRIVLTGLEIPRPSSSELSAFWIS